MGGENDHFIRRRKDPADKKTEQGDPAKSNCSAKKTKQVWGGRERNRRGQVHDDDETHLGPGRRKNRI